MPDSLHAYTVSINHYVALQRNMVTQFPLQPCAHMDFDLPTPVSADGSMLCRPQTDLGTRKCPLYSVLGETIQWQKYPVK